MLSECCVCADHAAATGSKGYSSCVSLAELAMHTMHTADSNCGDARIAREQLGRDGPEDGSRIAIALYFSLRVHRVTASSYRYFSINMVGR